MAPDPDLVLITAGCSRTGLALCHTLHARGKTVLLYDQRPPLSVLKPGVIWCQGTLADCQLLSEALSVHGPVGAVVYLGVRAAPQAGSEGQSSVHARPSFIQGTRNVVRACEQHGVQRLIAVFQEKDLKSPSTRALVAQARAEVAGFSVGDSSHCSKTRAAAALDGNGVCDGGGSSSASSVIMLPSGESVDSGGGNPGSKAMAAAKGHSQQHGVEGWLSRFYQHYLEYTGIAFSSQLKTSGKPQRVASCSIDDLGTQPLGQDASLIDSLISQVCTILE